MSSQERSSSDRAVPAEIGELESWKADGGNPRTRLLTANQLRFNWEALGFESKQQLSNFLTIMQNDTPVESRQMLLKQFSAKSMLTRT
jgi:hypothetical protein